MGTVCCRQAHARQNGAAGPRHARSLAETGPPAQPGVASHWSGFRQATPSTQVTVLTHLDWAAAVPPVGRAAGPSEREPVARSPLHGGDCAAAVFRRSGDGEADERVSMRIGVLCDETAHRG